MRTIKALTAVLSVCTAAAFLAGCSKTADELPTVNLSVWCAAEDVAMINSMLDSFQEEYADEAVFSFTVSEEGEDSCRETILADIESAADVFSFADDQFLELKEAGALLEITDGTDEIIAACGGAEAGAVQAAMSDGRLYALPTTASNGYFLYYNKNYFTE